MVQAVSIRELEFKRPLHYTSRGEQSKSLLILSINSVKPVILLFIRPDGQVACYYLAIATSGICFLFLYPKINIVLEF